MNQKNEMKRKFHIEHWHKVAALLMTYDLLAVFVSYFLALVFRFDFIFSEIPDRYFDAYLRYLPINAVICVVVFWFFKCYHSVWRFASYTEFWRTLNATLATSLAHLILITALFQRMPLSYHIFGTLIQFALMIGVRFSYRFVLLERSKRDKEKNAFVTYRVMLIGAGSAGTMILGDIQRTKETNMKVACIIDDNSNKWNRYISGVPVVGGRDDILLNVEKYAIDKIFIAIPSATASQTREIVNICKETGCDLKILPGMYQFTTGDITFDKMKDVAVEDLLGRDQIKVDLDEIFLSLVDKTVLVTGGGGSIGSELCRQIAAHNPGHIIIFDIYENNAYDIEQELKAKYPEIKMTVLIGSVRDEKRIDQIFGKYKPDIVYHAAAHKHVPLMETSPCEAIKNNTVGTYNVAYAADKNNTSKFVLISTDKAVNPTNIMGASKRLCEMIVQMMDKTSNTEFVAVRFGNVLGSNGSVIPLFKKQIARGGPVTVTHPDIIRYFMTIPEAVSLVLQAGVYAKGGEIFVLDMGEPVKIDTLARNLIKLSGYKPDVDIPIVYSGLRPGEKLYEEKLMDEEGLTETLNDLIHIARPIDMNYEQYKKDVVNLKHLALQNNDDNIMSEVAKIVPTYNPGTNE